MITVQFEVNVPSELPRLRLPDAVQERLQSLLDRQDSGEVLTESERLEAEQLVDLAELLTLLKLRAERLAGNS